MRVEVDRIGAQPLKVREEFSAKEWDLDRDDLKFTGLINIAAVFKRSMATIDVAAITTADSEIVCSRCLRAITKTFEYEFNRRYDLETLGNYIEINNDVREEILLNFPMKVLCAPGCKGLCQGCGRDLNLEKCDCK
jgi:uncharacterized metal-binding protein YceD (DUF177 family)